MTIGWSGAVGACWLWGASSARSTIADCPLMLAGAQFPELPAVLITSIAHSMCQVHLYFPSGSALSDEMNTTLR